MNFISNQFRIRIIWTSHSIKNENRIFCIQYYDTLSQKLLESCDPIGREPGDNSLDHCRDSITLGNNGIIPPHYSPPPEEFWPYCTLRPVWLRLEPEPGMSTATGLWQWTADAVSLLIMHFWQRVHRTAAAAATATME